MDKELMDKATSLHANERERRIINGRELVITNTFDVYAMTLACFRKEIDSMIDKHGESALLSADIDFDYTKFTLEPHLLESDEEYKARMVEVDRREQATYERLVNNKKIQLEKDMASYLKLQEKLKKEGLL